MLKNHGVRNYSIFMHSSGSVFGYFEVDDEADWLAFVRTPECQEWRSYMQAVLVYNADGTPANEPLREIFHLE